MDLLSEENNMRDFEEFVKYLESLKLYRQSRVTRWQLRDYAFTENDSEHQLYVSQIIVILVKMFNIPDDIAYKALSYGCCHDFVESTEESLGDVNYMVKEKNPELKALVKKLEKGIPLTNAYYEDCYRDLINNHDVAGLKKLIVEDKFKTSRSANFDWTKIEPDAKDV